MNGAKSQQFYPIKHSDSRQYQFFGQQKSSHQKQSIDSSSTVFKFKPINYNSRSQKSGIKRTQGEVKDKQSTKDACEGIFCGAPSNADTLGVSMRNIASHRISKKLNEVVSNCEEALEFYLKDETAQKEQRMQEQSPNKVPFTLNNKRHQRNR